MIYPIEPVAKPRMTRRDQWLKPPRPAVAKYWDFCSRVQVSRVDLPDQDAHILFVLPMPPSWSQKKKDLLDATPHRQSTPDLSNLLKALEDAARPGDDHKIWHYGSLRKMWGRVGRIEIQIR